MRFGVIYSVDCTADDSIENYLPPLPLYEAFSTTEEDEGFDYSYLEGEWEGGHHLKIVGVLTHAQFDEFVDKLGLVATDVETGGIVGAPWSESGVGWAPAISFDCGGTEAIQNAYVTPLCSSHDKEGRWERVRAGVIQRYGR
jgi:hypothetical protein